MKKVNIFMFIDALGWEVIKGRGFLEEVLPHRYPVKMQFGYSATAIPTILTGQPPTVHKHLSFYYYAPHKSPFKAFKYLMLHYLPSKLFDRWRVRHIFSKIIARLYGFTGYFEMYSMPFDRLHYFDYIEKQDMFVPNGLAPTPNLADELTKRKIPYHISNWRQTEDENINDLMEDLERGDIEFAFLYTAAMDGLLHFQTKDGEKIGPKLEWYSNKIKSVIEKAHQHYDEVTISVMSDHGMTTKTGVVEVKSVVESLPFKFGKDYVATYDSTMARFWFMSDEAKTKIQAKMSSIPHCHILSDDEKKQYRIDFDDHMYGETILLMDPGYQIEPCDMGVKALPGMHGFCPEHEDSYACYLSSEPVENPPEWVGDFFTLMVDKMDDHS